MPFSLISATVLRVRPIGVTSDYCPVCRKEHRFRLSQIEHKRYFMCIDQGRHGNPRHELTCMTCQCRLERPAEERPISILPDSKNADLFEPEMISIVQSRIDTCTSMELARSENRLTAEQRQEMIRHAFYCFASLYDEEPFERFTPIARLAIALVTLAVAFGGFYTWHHTDSIMAPILALVAIVFIFAALMFWVSRHSPRKQVRTWLAMALLPLEPTAKELRQARVELQGSRLNAGFQIRVNKLLAKINKLKQT